MKWERVVYVFANMVGNGESFDFVARTLKKNGYSAEHVREIMAELKEEVSRRKKGDE